MLIVFAGAAMKPLYHCAKCGRLSTVLGSYKCVGAQLYCKSHDDVSTVQVTERNDG